MKDARSLTGDRRRRTVAALLAGGLVLLITGCSLTEQGLDTDEMARKIARDVDEVYGTRDTRASCTMDTRTEYKCFLRGRAFEENGGSAVLPVQVNPDTRRFYYRLADAE